MNGTVLWWDERDGQGIIKGAEGLKYYFDTSVVKESMRAGTAVTFTINKAIKCTLCAKNVRRMK